MVSLQKFRSTSDDLSPSTISVNFFDDKSRSPPGLRSSSFTYEKSNGTFTDEPDFPPPKVPGTAEPIIAEPNGWRKKLRSRETLLIVLGCVLVIGLAVGTACAIIFTQRDYPSPSPLNATSSAPPSITSSSPSSSSSPTSTSTPPSFLVYSGGLNFSRPWPGSLQELNSNFSDDMLRIVYNTSLEKSYSSSRVTDYQYDKMYVSFSLAFTSELYEVPITTTTALVLNAAYGIIIENILRERVAQGRSALPIQPQTIHIFDYIPPTSTSASTSSSTSSSTTVSTTASTTASSTSASSTTASSTSPAVSPCSPLKYERCRSVGYNMIFFPNKFGDLSEEAAIPLFEALNNKTLASNCSSVSLFYLCGIWFPECDEKFAPAEPCPDVCEEFNSECKGDFLYSVACDHFDKPNCRRPPGFVTMTTTAAPTTTAPPYTCSYLNYDVCNRLGYNYTYLPNFAGNRNLSDVIRRHDALSDSIVRPNCSRLTEFYLCGLYFPQCGVENQRMFPCRNVCQTILDECGYGVSLYDCDLLADHDCLTPPPELTSTSTTATTPATTTPTPKPCVELTFATCRNLGYEYTRYPNVFGSMDEQAAVASFAYYAALSVRVGCSAFTLDFFCGLLFPRCDETATPRVKFPCRDFCQDVMASCSKFLPFQLDCIPFTNDPNTCQKSPVTTTPAPTTPMPGQCLKATYHLCRSDVYNSTYLPTWFAKTMKRSIALFKYYANSTIQSGCSDLAKFFYCGIFFPQCDTNDQAVRLPCRHVCEEMTRKCGSVWPFPIDCLAFSNNSAKCLQPPITTTTALPSTTPTPARCEPLDKDLCKVFGFNVTHLPNLWLANSQEQALNMYYAYGEKSVSLGCHGDALFYLCSVIFPQCDSRGNLQLSCRDVCQSVNDQCLKTGLFGQNCDRVSTSSPTCLSPPIKPVCNAGEFACFGTPKCIPQEKVCDRKNDCFDWSDERSCTCIPQYEFQCGMGHCIKSYQRCDELVDCPDRTDEENCTCPKGQFTCAENECVMPEWVCDGQRDCSNGLDELNCGSCDDSKFSCLSGECIPLSQQCDGTPQCRDQSDERQCIFSPEDNNPLTLRFYRQGLVPVCAVYFNSTLADLACQKLGHVGHYNWSSIDYSTFIYVYLDGIGTEITVLGRASLRKTCLNSKVVVLNCIPKVCGTRKSHMISFIVNGNNAAKGAWPWQVSVQRVNKHHCGGSLISDKFVVTAAHCVEVYRLDFRYITVVIGASDISKKERHQKRVKVKRLLIHDHIYHVKNDIALIELAEPVAFNDYVRPVCLPGDDDVFSRTTQCYSTGWGRLVSDEGPKPSWLQEAKMTLWNTDKCNSSLAWNTRISDTHVCAGYYSGLISPCMGDSGGPLVCQTNDNTWKLRGVTSFVSKKCNQPGRPAVYSDVIVFKQWIEENTKCKFKCSNGVCLYDDRLLCNRINDCGDNSDEILPCNVSVNCTFDDPFLCGYYVQFKNLAVTTFNNHYPLYDHTYGNYRGKFMTALTSGRIMTSPVYKMNATHCVRFHYHARGQLTLGLHVWNHEVARNTWASSFTRERAFCRDRWLTGELTLPAGEYEIVFMANEKARISIDDVSVVPGDCQQIDCPPGQFTCLFGSSVRCIPEEARCNFIADCDNAEDELQCQTVPAYSCDFERNLLCGFEQHTDDSALAEWRVGNSSTTPKHINDNTLKTEAGNMLFLDTSHILRGKTVTMSQKLYLSSSTNCLMFYYYSDASGKLEIQYTKRGTSNPVVIWSIIDRMTQGWTHTQVDIPVSGYVTLDYVMTSGQYKGTYRPLIALDDVQMTVEACGSFTCPTGFKQCLDENYCLKSGRFCDRFVDCSDASDESSCTCTNEEFKCPGGPCIPKSKTCDRSDDCKDGSDEKAICDSKIGVTCDFEDSFICGYSINNTAYKWERHSGPTDTPNTGPKIDKTYGNSSGHYIYADGTYGNYGDVSTLETPTFSSADGIAVEFSYNIFSALYKFYSKLGSLALVVVDRERNTRTQLFTDNADGDTEWKRGCVDLPTSANLSLVFYAERGNENQADVAVDDVKLLTSRCSVSDRVTDPSHGILEPTQHPTGCSSGSKPCDSGACLPRDLFCDGYSDCPNGSDERDCP